MEIRRIVLIVLDSVGVGELPDAKEYGDEGSNTLANIAKAVGGLDLPHLELLGIGNLTKIKGIKRVEDTLGAYGKMCERSKGKDTTSGHWEIAGIILREPFPTYPQGFPPEIIAQLKKAIGRPVLGNYPASGTEIIAKLGEEHLRTGYPIIYTSADSVFQIAAHEEVIPVEELYEMCLKARSILKGRHGVARVIARPFVGQPGSFKRTERRRDFSLPPPEETILEKATKFGYEVCGLGKIEDIFGGKGLTSSIHTKNNQDGIDKTIDEMKSIKKGIIFTNLIDFDMLYGHRNDPVGYAAALKEFDSRLPEIRDNLKNDGLLILTADHGCDPTTPSTDHSREYVPLLVYGSQIKGGIELGIRHSFADIAQTIADILHLPPLENGVSFRKEILGG